MPSQRVHFLNESKIKLSGILDMPAEGKPVAFAIFAHCFTCTKDLKAIVRVSRGLAAHQIGVLRFDFTGLGDSQGEFSDSNFESNIADIVAAAKWLADEHEAPSLLIGMSLGGAAAMAAMGAEKSNSPSHPLAGVKALTTLAAPSCTAHLAEFLLRTNPEIESVGSGTVTIGGRSHLIKNQMLESLRNFDLQTAIGRISIPHLVLHSPEDETLDYRHATEIFSHTAGAKAMVTLDGSDHLLVNQPEDVGFVADLIAVWSKRFIE
jgi:putative redox protein